MVLTNYTKEKKITSNSLSGPLWGKLATLKD